MEPNQDDEDESTRRDADEATDPSVAADDDGDEETPEPDGDGSDADDVVLEDDEDDEGGPSRATLLIGAVVVFVAIAVAGILIASSGGDSDGGGDGDAAEVGDNRTDVAVFGSIEQFDRADSRTTLGPFGDGTTGREWSSETGVWGIEGGKARVFEPAEFEGNPVRDHAVIGLGSGDGGIQVRMDTVTAQSGLVFRYRGPYNYWMVVAAPRAVTWNIYKVTDGQQELMGNTGQSPVADGTTIAVRLEGETIEVIVNGRVRKTVVDGFQRNDGKVGITATGEDAVNARFDEFHASLPGGNPLRPLEETDGGEGTDGSTPPTTGGGP